MARPPKPLTFLARDSYRQRRLRDVAWVLPVVGAALVMVPLLWPREGDRVEPTSSALIFVFLVWMALILTGLVLARLMKMDPTPTAAEDDAGGPG